MCPEILEANKRPAPRLSALWRATRAFSLPVSVLPVVLAAAAVLPVWQWRWDVLIASALGAALLHAAGNLINDYFDFARGVDLPVAADDTRPGMVLPRGLLTPRQVLVEGIVCLLAGLAAGAYVVAVAGPMILAFAAAAAIGIYAYTGPPFELKYHALGEPTIFVVFGPLLMAGAAWAQVGHLSAAALLLSVPVGLATTAILVGNNYRDRLHDDQAGIRTLGHFAKGNVARAVYLLTVAGAVGVLAVYAAIGLAPHVLLASPLLLALLARPLRELWHHHRLPDIDARTARFETVLLVAAIIAYVVRGPIGV